MQSFLRKLLPGSRYPYAVLAGVVLAFAFPNFSVAGFAWVAPALFIGIVIGTSGWETFRVGYVAGLAHYLVSLSWLLNIPFRWHGIPLAPALGWLALSAFLAFFVGAWVWLLNRLASNSAETPVPHRSVSAMVCGFLTKPWSLRLLWCLAGAAAWVSLEMLLARIFGGFPWNVLAASQFRLTPLLQIASITGVYGLSFLIVWFSLSLLSAAVQMVRNPFHRSLFFLEIATPILVIALLFNWGIRQMRSTPEPEKVLTLTLVQPSIPQTLIWDSESDDLRMRELIALSRDALASPTDLLVWPEAAVPKLLRYDQEVYDAVMSLAREHQVWMIIGADDAEPGDDPKQPKYFNSSFLIGPDGNLRASYKKRALVIFGEYLPLSRWLPFLKYFTPIQGGFTAGTEPVQFHLPPLGVTTSVLICYEDIFPQVGRSAAAAETDFLINITNDGWFGEGAAQWQQAVTGMFRAIENRMPLVRCTNNGLTCWIDAHGRIRDIFRDAQGSIYGRGFLRIRLPVRQDPTPTFYNRYGDWFGWTCVFFTVFALGLALIRTRKRSTSG